MVVSHCNDKSEYIPRYLCITACLLYSEIRFIYGLCASALPVQIVGAPIEEHIRIESR